MISSGRFRWKLAFGLLAAVTFNTLLQLTWKSAVLETPDDLSPWATLDYVFASPLFIAVIAIMAFQFFNWLVVLGQADLSYAVPVASLSYASVPTMSAIFLHEAIDIVEITGVALVLVGVWFISQTKPLTKDAPELP